MIDPTTLITGGIIGAIAGFWSQFRTLLMRLSSLVVVQAHLATNLQYPTRIYIKKHFKHIPSGIRFYNSTLMRVMGFKNRKMIPFRQPYGSAVYWRRGEMIVWTGRTILTIRGLCDVDRLIQESIQENEREDKDQDSQVDRFYIHPVKGLEKGPWRGGQKAEAISRAPTGGTGEDNSPSDQMLDTNVEKSFMYSSDFYKKSYDSDPFESLYFADDVIRHIEDALKWVKMGDWYSERSIPWRMGWAIEGPGGTGKSSLARAMAEKMRVPLMDFKLNTLSDQEFLQEWENVQSRTPCVILFEDFDNVFDGRTALTEHRSLSFDTVLNAISGVDSASGVLLIVTTNHLEKIDPAMGVFSKQTELNEDQISTRPGRLDTVIHLGKMNRENRLKMATKILRDWPDLIDGTVAKYADVTPAQFQEACVVLAFQMIHKEKETSCESKTSTNRSLRAVRDVPVERTRTDRVA